MRRAILPKAIRILPLSISLLILFRLPARSMWAAEPKPNRRVLVLYEAGTANPGSNLIDQGIHTALDASPYKLEVYREYLDTPLFPDPADQLRFREFYIRKYQNRRPDVIITVGPSPLKFMVEMRDRGFPGVPVIFCFPQWGYRVSPPLPPDFTGVEANLATFETVQAALRLQPGTRHIVVVGGSGYFDAQAEDLVKEQLRPYEDNFDLSYFTNLTMPNLLERLKHLPNQTIVLLSAFSQDAAGTKFVFASESAPAIVAAANAPVFSTIDSTLNRGQVGGKVGSLEQAGETAGGMALRILKGERPQDILRVKAPTVYMWDWRILKHWGLEEKNLPPGSIVLNRQPSVWELYSRYIMAGIFVLFVQAMIISGLLWQRARRKKAQTELTRSNSRLMLAEEALSTVNQKLIGAHEEERARIARELHDDVNQRLAVLAVTLDKLREDFPSSPAELKQGIDEANKQTQDLASDVQALSHRLHSSKLEFLGLPSAATGFCRELSSQRGVDIRFQSENIPKNLPKDVSLCLFRVLQEALQNGIKHSGSRRFEVRLSDVSGEIELTVSDSGIGFDLEAALKHPGLGITSMTERLKLVNGNLSITSQPQCGTTIRARVPLVPIKVSAAKVG